MKGVQSRILGILLDNALKSTNKSKKHICVSFLEEQIIVGNTYESIIDINQLFKYAYSSTRRNLGMALYSLKQILKKYPYQIKTGIDEGYFTQRVLIENCKLSNI